MMFIYKSVLLIWLLLVSFGPAACKPQNPKANPYTEDKKVGHSLYREHDSIDRMSNSAEGVPPPKGK